MADWKSLAKTPKEWTSLKYDDPRLDAFAQETEKKHGLPPGMLVALKNAGEKTNPGQVSPVGARGIMQFMPKEVEQFKHNPDDPFESINAAGVYMKTLIKENTQRWKNVHGNAPIDMKRVYHAALANYNGGPRQAIAVLKGQEPPAEESRNYVNRIVSYLDKNYKPARGEPIAQQQQIRVAQQSTIPTNLEEMSHMDLLKLRKQFEGKEEQNKIAPYEHRAWAREHVKENPEAALVMPGLIMAYNMAKGLGVREGRSDPSAKAILEGLKGTVEGLGGRAREAFTSKDFSWPPLPSYEELVKETSTEE